MKTKEDVENQQRSNEERWPSAKSSYFPTPTPPTEKCECPDQNLYTWPIPICSRCGRPTSHSTDKGWEKDVLDFLAKEVPTKDPSRFSPLLKLIRREREEEYARGRKDAVEFILGNFPKEDTPDTWRAFTQVMSPHQIVQAAVKAPNNLSEHHILCSGCDTSKYEGACRLSQIESCEKEA